MALGWLARIVDEGRPFFLFLNYMDCHQPYGLRDPLRYHFISPEKRRTADAVPQDPFAIMAGRISVNDGDLEHLQAIYDGCLRYLDHHIGLLWSWLEDRDLTEETIFIVTSDHGESFGEHGLMDHQYGLFEPLIGVPLIIRFPSRSEMNGIAEDGLVQHVDLLPTLLDVLELSDTRAETAGLSLFGSQQRQESFAEYLVPNVRAIQRRFPNADIARFDRAMRSVSTTRYKMVQVSDGREHLYDLVADPGELVDMSAKKPHVVEQLRRRAISVLGDWPKPCEPPPSGNDMEELRERLELLGYL